MVGSLLDVKKYSQGRGGGGMWVESGLIGVSPWGTGESWGWGSRVQTRKNLEPLLETKAGAAVTISEKLGCLCPLLKSEMLQLFYQSGLLLLKVLVVTGKTGHLSVVTGPARADQSPQSKQKLLRTRIENGKRAWIPGDLRKGWRGRSPEALSAPVGYLLRNFI